MLVKIKKGGTELQFNSTEVDIAILFTPKDKQEVEKMEHGDLLLVSAPLASMRDRAAEVWQWAMTGWKGATHIDPGNVRAKF